MPLPKGSGGGDGRVGGEPGGHAFLAPPLGLQILLQEMGFQAKGSRADSWGHRIFVWPPTVVSGSLRPVGRTCCLIREAMNPCQDWTLEHIRTRLGGSWATCNHSWAHHAPVPAEPAEALGFLLNPRSRLSGPASGQLKSCGQIRSGPEPSHDWIHFLSSVVHRGKQ